MLNRFYTLVVLFICVELLILGTPVVGESPRPRDFGAETVEPDEVFDEMVKPLPPEMVEDRNKSPKDKEEASQKSSKGKSNTGENTADFNFPKTQGELSELLDEGSEGKKEQSSKLSGSASASTFLNVKDADIATLVKTFSKITKRNFIVDSDVKGKITIHLPSAVTEEEALRIFDSVLLIKGFTTVPVGNNTWKVIGAKDAKSTTIPLVADSGPKATDTLVTQLLRMKYVPAEEMQKVLSQFISKDGIINAFTGTNSLIVIDSAANINRLLKIVKELDVPAADQDITIIPIKYAEATDISEKILKILQDDTDKSQSGTPGSTPSPRPTPNPGGMPGVSGQRTAPQGGSGATVGARALPLKIIPDERTNSVIVVADQEMTARVEALAKQLDSPLDLSGGRFHVYKLKHSKAEEIAQVLNAIVSGQGSSYSPTKKSRGSSMSRGQNSRSRSNQFGSNSNFNNYTPPAPTPPSAPVVSGGGANSGQQKGSKGLGAQSGRVTFEGEVSIAPDISTNSLIINASKADFQKLVEVLEIIDARRRQVIVEATILEVTLTKQEGMGVELQGTVGTNEGGVIGQTNFGGLTNVLTNPAALSDLTIAAASSGTLTLPGGFKIPSQAFLVSALSKLSNVNVLSAPTILTTDNEEAEIIVGENVPFVTGTSQNNANLNNTFNQVDRQDVGITLRITPQISTSNFVTLEIFVEISNVVPSTKNDSNGPTTTIRTTETVVEVKNKQMIVTGGLIADSVTESTRGVPFVQDIPVIGQYFQRQDTDVRRTNLLIFLTPRIIIDQYEARDSTVEAKNLLETAIEKSDKGPDRKEVLNRSDIDNVFETRTESEAEKPSMITPPRNLENSTSDMSDNNAGGKEIPLVPDVGESSAVDDKELSADNNRTPKKPIVKRDVRIEKPQAKISAKNNSDALELSVTPRLPGEERKVEKEPASSDPVNTRPEKPSHELSSIRFQNESADTAVSADDIPFTYVVLRAINSPTPDTLGVGVFGAPDSLNSSFFQVGGKYSHKNAGRMMDYVCIGKYRSREDASQQFSELAEKDSWHYMSQSESKRLGSTDSDSGWLSK